MNGLYDSAATNGMIHAEADFSSLQASETSRIHSFGCFRAIMGAAELYAKANDAYFDDDFDEALSLFSQAINAEPNNAEFLLKRYDF